jgi:hypothetical protein
MIRLPLSLLIITVLFACKPAKKEQSYILPPKKMQVVLWDYIRIDTYDAEIASKNKKIKDTLDNISRQNALFQHHKISKEVFQNSLAFYKNHPQEFLPILDSILTMQDRSKTFDPLNLNF